MILNLPKIGDVQFDENLSTDEIYDQINKLGQKFGFEYDRPKLGYGEMFTRGIHRGLGELGSEITQTAPALLGKALGFDDFAKRKLDEAAETQAKLQSQYAPQYKSFADIKHLSDYPGYAF